MASFTEMETHKSRPHAASVATRVITANQRVVKQSTAVVVMAVVAAAASAMAVIYTRPTHTTSFNSQSALVDKNNNPVATAPLESTIANLTMIPSLGPLFDYNQIQRLSLTILDDEATGDHGRVGFRTTGYHWLNETDMDLFLTNDMTLHISAGALMLAKTELDLAGRTVVGHRRELIVCGGVCVGAAAVVGAAVIGTVMNCVIGLFFDGCGAGVSSFWGSMGDMFT